METHRRTTLCDVTGPDATPKASIVMVSDSSSILGGTAMNVLDSTSGQRSTAMAGQKLSGKVALVTGGTRGIGAAICRSLASQGASVAAGYSGNRDRAEQFLKELEEDSSGQGRASIHQGNVSHPEDCRRVVQEVLGEHGRIDILVNNAGITMDKMAMKMSVEEWNTVLAVNLSGSFFMAQPALEHMVERGTGRIIFVSSVIGETGNIGQSNYAASKAGLLGLTKTLAKEAAFILARAGRLEEDGVGITVNTVTPGFVATEMLENVPEKVLDKIRSQIPVGRLCRPEEIARVVHFLAADASAYITGQVWGVNGGLDM
jgi:3-oxoacyl-[acyl-carrier protein] reductase